MYLLGEPVVSEDAPKARASELNVSRHWKDTMSLKNFFSDKYFWIASIVGVILMLFALHFNINPVEGSVVPQYIQDTGIHIFLFVTCMPAWILGYIIGYLVSFFLPVSFSVMACITQFFFYGALCKIIRRGINSLKIQ